MDTPVDAPQIKAWPVESKMHRLRIGDIVEWLDNSTWPPTHCEGPINAFSNDEGSYIECHFTSVDGVTFTKELTEDEVHRVS